MDTQRIHHLVRFIYEITVIGRMLNVGKDFTGRG